MARVTVLDFSAESVQNPGRAQTRHIYRRWKKRRRLKVLTPDRQWGEEASSRDKITEACRRRFRVSRNFVLFWIFLIVHLCCIFFITIYPPIPPPPPPLCNHHAVVGFLVFFSFFFFCSSNLTREDRGAGVVG